MGGLDILINNAGIITRGDITAATDDDYARTMAINGRGTFSSLPRRDPNHGGLQVGRGHRKHILLLGRASGPEPSGLCHVKGRNRLADPMPWHGPCPSGHPGERSLPE